MPWTEWTAIAEGQKTESRNCPECCLSNRPNLDFIMKLTLNFWRAKYIPFASLDLLIFTTCRYKYIFFFLVMFRRVVFCLKMAGIQKSLAKGGKAICYQMKKYSSSQAFGWVCPPFKNDVTCLFWFEILSLTDRDMNLNK